MYSNIQMAQSDVHSEIIHCRTRSDILDLFSVYNFGRWWDQMSKLTISLTDKQFHKVHGISDPLERISAIEKVTKSQKKHDELHRLKMYLAKCFYVHNNVNPVALFDDSEPLWRNEDSINISLKVS